MEMFKAMGVLTFILVATCLLCWIFSSDRWIFDPITGLIVFMGGAVAIGFFGFISIEERTGRR
jgi:hypothetical protein